MNADAVHITVCRGQQVPEAVLRAIADAVRDGHVIAVAHTHPDGYCADCDRVLNPGSHRDVVTYSNGVTVSYPSGDPTPVRNGDDEIAKMTDASVFEAKLRDAGFEIMKAVDHLDDPEVPRIDYTVAVKIGCTVSMQPKILANPDLQDTVIRVLREAAAPAFSAEAQPWLT